MDRLRSSAPRLSNAAAIADLLNDDGTDGQALREVLAAQHQNRHRRQPRQIAAILQDGVCPGSAGPNRERTYRILQPTSSLVLNAFLNELDQEGRAHLVRGGLADKQRAHHAMWLLDQARQLIPRMLSASGDVRGALALLPRFRPNPAAEDPWLYMRVARGISSELGAIAGDYERSVAIGEDEVTACVVAAFAGQLTALAVRLLGPHLYDDLVRQARQPGGPPTPAPAERATSRPVGTVRPRPRSGAAL